MCNRGGAKTLLTAYAACCLLDNLDNFRVSIVSGSKDQASVCYEYARDIFLGTSMKTKIKGESTLSQTLFTNNSRIIILPASEKRTRAPRSDLIIIDEACEAKEGILTSTLPQAITSSIMKLVVLTTPNKLTHIAKKWWDDYQKLGFIRYQWDAYRCPWIPRKNIADLKNIFDDATFQIEVMARWVSATGAVFNYADIQAALIDMKDLPAFDEINLFALGIDWGDAHETVASVIGMTGEPKDFTDQWWLYAVKAWRREHEAVILDEICELIDIYGPRVLSEQSGSSAFSNRELKARLAGSDIIMKTGSFTGKKHRMVRNFRARLEKRKAKIPKQFTKTIDQLIKFHTKPDSEDYAKEEDDHVDSLVWAHWVIHPAMGGVQTLGEWEIY